jgi:hypothetical protein
VTVDLTRPEIIRDAIIQMVTENMTNLFVSPCEAASWVSYPTAPWSRFGWRPPLAIVRDERVVLSIPICPDLIDQQTAHLSNDDLKKYLTVLSFLMSHSAATLSGQDTVDDSTVQQAVWDAETELDATNPGAMRFLTEVCARILDHDDQE